MQPRINYQKLVPDLFDFGMLNQQGDQIGSVPVINLRQGGVDRSSYFIVAKSLLDRLLALLAILVLWPLMLAIAIGVKLGSPGPALFRQRRHGLGGREFWMLKFRSMRMHASGAAGPASTWTSARPSPPLWPSAADGSQRSVAKAECSTVAMSRSSKPRCASCRKWPIRCATSPRTATATTVPIARSSTSLPKTVPRAANVRPRARANCCTARSETIK